MTPKEKADELYNEFEEYASYIDDHDWSEEALHLNTIACVNIAVNAIIKEWEYIDTYIADMGGDLSPNLKYWYEVRSHLPNL